MPHNHPDAHELLKRNGIWASRQDPSVLKRIAEEKQSPKVVWLGCVDSRVPESLITQVYLGDIFTHRNIANQVQPNDINAISVLFYAIDHVEVEHVVVVGHSRCGGVIAALEAKEHPPEPPIDQWMKPLIELAEKYPKLEDLVEANIRVQVANVLQLLQNHELKRPVTVHGWLYHLEDGHLHVLEEHEVNPRHLSSYKL